MRRLLLLLIPLHTVAALAGTYPDVGYTPPAGWDEPKFILSQEYPQSPPAAEVYPWAAIDFKTQPAAYLRAVLAYCYEGNLEAEFAPAANARRSWYHAPWLHYGANGREFVRGLTRERSSRPYELSATQTQTYRNYAVGLYNDQGGYTLGRVWRDPAAPALDGVAFPEGTVTFKMLFTTAPESIAPFLQGAPEWVADIDRSPDVAVIKATKVRLLQVDVAVKDRRSKCGGWVFGTFHYDASMPGATPWEKLRPLTLMWGNDPTLTETMAGAGTRPVETWLDEQSPIAQYRRNPPAGATPPRDFGWAGRGNGPVDNPASSCLSCHATAQIPAASPMTPRPGTTEAEKLRWFRNLAATEPFDTGSHTLDFSLQLGVGVQNFEDFQTMVGNMGGVFHAGPKRISSFLRRDETPDRQWRGSRPQQYRFSRDPEQ